MNTAFLLLSCMCALLHGTHCMNQNETSSSAPANGSSETFSPTDVTTKTSETTTQRSTATPTRLPTRRANTTAPQWNYVKECLYLYFLIGGLIILLTILLLLALVLSCKVCQLRRRIKRMKNQDGELISNSDYWMGTARKNKSKPKIDSMETSVLMVDIVQNQEELKSGEKPGDRNDDVKGNEEGPKEEEASKKTDGSTASEDAEKPTTDTV